MTRDKRVFSLLDGKLRFEQNIQVCRYLFIDKSPEIIPGASYVIDDRDETTLHWGTEEIWKIIMDLFFEKKYIPELHTLCKEYLPHDLYCMYLASNYTKPFIFEEIEKYKDTHDYLKQHYLYMKQHYHQTMQEEL